MYELDGTNAYGQIFPRMLEDLDCSYFDSKAVSSLRSLSAEANLILTRLYLRKRRWLSRSDLQAYLPEDKLQTALDELESEGWIETDVSLEEHLNMISVKELQAVGALFNVKGLTAKPELVASLAKLSRQKNFYGVSIAAKMQRRLLKITSGALRLVDQQRVLEYIVFMFLAPAGSTLQMVVLANMGKIRYPSYEWISQKDSPLFHSRKHFLDYYEACTLCEAVDSGKYDGELANAVWTAVRLWSSDTEPTAKTPESGSGSSDASFRLNVFFPGYVYGRALGHIAMMAGPQGVPTELKWIERYLSQDLHRSKRGLLLVRRMFLETKLFSLQNDTVWLRRALNTYYDAVPEVGDIERLDLARKSARLSKLLAKNQLAAPVLIVPAQPEFKTVSIPRIKSENVVRGRTQWAGEDAILTVERTALAHYAQSGWEGGHFENRTLSTLFWLALADIIYSYRPAFACQYQSRPLKLQAVLEIKAQQVEMRLEDPRLSELVLAAYDEHAARETQLGGVHWAIPRAAIEALVESLPFAKLLQRVARDYHRYSSGFPDLTLWRPGEAKFAEVKSDNDTLSDNQIAWIHYMTECGIDVEVCKVVGSSKRPRRADG